jgi:putative ABC transport system permease protein
MEILSLLLRNVFRHRLRTSLTVLGVAVAMLAFGILRTLVDAWYVGVEASSAYRLVTRNKTSLIYMLPLAYKNRIFQISGVTGLGYGLWYAGVYKDKKNFFAQFAISGTDYLDLYPEFLLSEKERNAFQHERNAAVAGTQLAERFGWKIGDVIPLEGTIFPGKVELTLRGIYRGATKNVDQTALFFRWDYLNETLKKTLPDQADKVGWYLIQIKEADRAAQISEEIDAVFRNSLAETLTETEKAFQLGFVAMTDALVRAIQVISVVVIGIILMVLANTMAMTVRERSSEYAVLKTLGFRPWSLFILISGESVLIAVIGGILGAFLTFPGATIFQAQLRSFLPVFEISTSTLWAILAVSFSVGLAASVPPLMRVIRMKIAEGLSHIG